MLRPLKKPILGNFVGERFASAKSAGVTPKTPVVIPEILEKKKNMKIKENKGKNVEKLEV